MTTSLPAPRLPSAFLNYWAGITVTGLAYSVVGIALPFLVLATDPAQPERAVGAVVLAGSLPFFFGPALGALVDRTPPRRILGIAPLLRSGLVLGVGWLALHGTVTLSVLLGLAFLNGLLTSLSFTAGSALIPRIVPTEQLPQANSLQSAGLMGAPLLGYGLGGWLVAHLGAGETLLLCGPFIAALAVASLGLPRLSAAQAGRSNPLADLREGWQSIGRHRYLLDVLALSFVLNAAMNLMNARSPLFMRDYGRGAADYALFEMLISGGVLLGIALVSLLSKRFSLDALIRASAYALALFCTGFVTLSVPIWWGCGLLFGAGLGLMQVAATTRSQEVIAPEVRGRVMGTLMAVNAVGLSLGAGMAGLGIETRWLMLGLVVTLLLLSVTWRAK